MKSVNTRPVLRKAALAVGGAAFLALSLTMASHGSASWTLPNYLTFSQAVALPGVTLPAGSYVFQVMGPTFDAVLVMNRDHSKVHFVGLTIPARRPAGMPADQFVSVGEAPRGVPVPIRAWFPTGDSVGYAFIY